MSKNIFSENKEESEEVDNEINEMSTIDRSNDTENENIPQTPSESVSQDSTDSQIEETEKQEEKMDKEGITDIKEESTGLQEENTDVIEQRTDSQESTDTQDEKADSNEMSEKTNCVDNDGDEKKDEVGKPEFETAPNISIDEPQDDHTQVL